MKKVDAVGTVSGTVTIAESPPRRDAHCIPGIGSADRQGGYPGRLPRTLFQGVAGGAKDLNKTPSKWSSVRKIPNKVKTPRLKEKQFDRIEEKIKEWNISLKPGWREAFNEEDRAYRGVRHIFHGSSVPSRNYPQYEEWRYSLQSLKLALDQGKNLDELRTILSNLDDVSRRKLGCWETIEHLETAVGPLSWHKKHLSKLSESVNQCLSAPYKYVKHPPTRNLARKGHIFSLIKIFERYSGQKATISVKDAASVLPPDKLTYEGKADTEKLNQEEKNLLLDLRKGPIIDFVCGCLRFRNQGKHMKTGSLKGKSKRKAIISEIEKILQSEAYRHWREAYEDWKSKGKGGSLTKRQLEKARKSINSVINDPSHPYFDKTHPEHAQSIKEIQDRFGKVYGSEPL